MLKSLRGDARLVNKEMLDIEEQLKRPQRGWTFFRANPNFRRSVGLGVALQMMQQFTGMNVVMYYAPRIFADVGFKGHEALWGTALVGLVNVLSTFVAIALVDKVGRRPVLLVGFAVMAVGLGALGVLLHFGTTDVEMQIVRCRDAAGLHHRLRGLGRAADLGAVFRGAADRGPRLRDGDLHVHQLGVKFRRRPHLPDNVDGLGQRRDIRHLCRAERGCFSW